MKTGGGSFLLLLFSDFDEETWREMEGKNWIDATAAIVQAGKQYRRRPGLNGTLLLQSTREGRVERRDLIMKQWKG